MLQYVTKEWPTWHRVSPDDVERYRSEVSDKLEPLLEHAHNSGIIDIDQFYDQFISIIQTCAKSTIPCKKYNPHTKPYWNEDVKTAHRRETEKRRAWIQAGRPRGMQFSTYAEYKKAKREFRNCQHKAQNEYITSTLEDIDQAAGCDIRLFWKLVKGQKPKRNRVYPELKSSTGMANTPNSVAEAFARYFGTIYDSSQNDHENFDNEHNDFIENEYENIKHRIISNNFDQSVLP